MLTWSATAFLFLYPQSPFSIPHNLCSYHSRTLVSTNLSPLYWIYNNYIQIITLTSILSAIFLSVFEVEKWVKIKVKVELSLCLTTPNPIKTYGAMQVYPHILHLGIKCAWLVSFSSRLLYPAEKTLIPIWQVVGAQSRCGCGGERKTSLPVPRTVTVLTEISWISCFKLSLSSGFLHQFYTRFLSPNKAAWNDHLGLLIVTTHH